ncbi:hypothetical protein AAG570_010811 [Ranatra chinensis]|uniref:Reverse transcriptase domain-containing protein n=1 Tax=Ranatra chinensis TaxID=642074 RepID=A0ABD0YIS8_9HEMI
MMAIILPIPKPGKELTQISSYRPITLLNTTLKILERIITNRLNWHLNNNFFHPDSYGYRLRTSTIHAVDKLITDIQQGYQTNWLTLAIFFDTQRAYDTVPTDKLIATVNDLPIPHSMKRFISVYLINRQFYIRCEGLSKRQESVKLFYFIRLEWRQVMIQVNTGRCVQSTVTLGNCVTYCAPLEYQ